MPGGVFEPHPVRPKTKGCSLFKRLMNRQRASLSDKTGFKDMEVFKRVLIVRAFGLGPASRQRARKRVLTLTFYMIIATKTFRSSRLRVFLK
ncbi:hypothetical protein X474_14235 [Dethiosulfatarculus sandiegensis]|uniref:Uncharacterized protein n=1 Tax=Dethiosulfatarculus sandiegensis TaxID=1429043 RepID=A0A0D2HSB8_9BACT|nr:hypothetical protein X474_14235 [Dethiosulfatarculus sandiegensis]